MKDIDFLPSGYRQKHSRQHVQLWRVVVIAGFLGMLSVATLVQYGRLCHARSAHEQIATQRKAAEGQNDQLARLQSELKKANGDAELFTYLGHPWPRTQILSAILTPLPDSVTLGQLEIISGTSRKARRGPGRGKSEEEAIPQEPALRDLAVFREQADSAPPKAILTGRTTDPEALHKYIGKLDRCSLFEKAEIDWIKSVASGKDDLAEGMMEFQAVVVIRPGYGQPGGPVGSYHVVLGEKVGASEGGAS